MAVRIPLCVRYVEKDDKDSSKKQQIFQDMKKIGMIIMLVFTTMTASRLMGQVVVGVSGSFMSDRSQGSREVDYFSNSKSKGFDCGGTLRVGYSWSPRWSAGLIGCVEYAYYFGSSWFYQNYGDLEPSQYEYKYENKNEVIGWGAGAYLRYRLPITEHVGLFAELTAIGGSLYQRSSNFSQNYVSPEPAHQTVTYGPDKQVDFQLSVVPGLTARIGGHVSVDLYFDLLQLGYIYCDIIDKRGREYSHNVYSSFVFGMPRVVDASAYINIDNYPMANTNWPLFDMLRLGLSYTF